MKKLLHGHEVHGIDAQGSEVIKAGFFSFFIFQTGQNHGRNRSFQIFWNRQAIGKILHMHFIGNQVFECRPAFGKWSGRTGFVPDAGFSVGFIYYPGVWVGYMNRMCFKKEIARLGMAMNREIIPGTVQVAGQHFFPYAIPVFFEIMHIKRNRVFRVAVQV